MLVSVGPHPGYAHGALHLPDDHTLSDAEIDALKQQRLDNWLAIVNAPPSEVVDVPAVTVADSIGHAADQSPEQFRQTFDELMHDRIVAALDTKKQEVASSYFSSQDQDNQGNEEVNGQDAESNS